MFHKNDNRLYNTGQRVLIQMLTALYYLSCKLKVRVDALLVSAILVKKAIRRYFHNAGHFEWSNRTHDSLISPYKYLLFSSKFHFS